MRTEFFLAGRYLRPRRNAVSLITLSSVIGVMLGVAVLLIVLAVMTGFTDLMKAKLVETQAHFQVRPGWGKTIQDPASVVAEIERHGAQGSPVIQAPVLIQIDQFLDPRILLFGADAEALKKHLDFNKHLQAGSLSLEKNELIISSAMARRWGVGIGQRVILHSAPRLAGLFRFKSGGGIELNDSKGYLPAEFRVSGIYSMGKFDFDNSVVFGNIDDAAELLKLPWGSATAVYGWGRDPFQQNELIERLRSGLPGMEVRTWEENNRQLLGVLAVEKRMMFFLLVFIVLVAAFSISNTLITSVYQKTREIGLLKALGASDFAVMQVFVLQGFLVGAVGSVCGVALGSAVIGFRNQILHGFSRLAGQDLFPKEFYYFNELPAHIIWSDVTVIVVLSVLLCTVGALLPALRAARLDPGKALRYE